MRRIGACSSLGLRNQRIEALLVETADQALTAIASLLDRDPADMLARALPVVRRFVETGFLAGPPLEG